MRYTVTIAGRSLAWTFAGSERIDAWLANRPWSAGGGLLVVRLASPDAVDPAIQALRSAIRASDDDAEVRVDTLSTANDGLARACAEWLGLGAELGDLERHDLLARKLASQPRVFVLRPQICTLDEARELVERLQKHRDEPSPTLILLDTCEHPAGGDACDLAVGWPVQPLLKEPGIPERQLWPAYLHHRVAWEAGGVPERAQRWDGGSLAAIAATDDAAFEGWLNDRAIHTTAGFSEELLELLIDLLNRSLGLTTSDPPGPDAEARLLAQGLLWRWPGAAAVQPVPFVARALLLRRDAAVAPLKPLLRSCLVCTPLAQEVLARCLELEARERVVVRARGDLIAPPPDLERRWTGFERGDASSDRQHFPPGCPASPEDAWTFAPFGELLNATRRWLPGSKHRHELRRLRNAVAHGTYLCWATITTLRGVERALV